MVLRGVDPKIWFGAALVILYTAVISGADGITKLMAADYAPPQLFAFSGSLVAVFSAVANRLPGQRKSFRTTCPWLMGCRSLATVLACIAYYYAFRLLPFADVFVFIALSPIFAAVMAGPILQERVSLLAWCALGVGVVGVYVLTPAAGQGAETSSLGIAIAIAASVLGTLSITLSRLIGRHEDNALAQVFYPNLSLGVVMFLCLPFVWEPMSLTDTGWVLAYSVLLFLARWLVVLAVQILPAYTVMPLLNVQFIWMILIGIVFFAEVPPLGTYLGMLLVVGSGAFLLFDQARGGKSAAQAIARPSLLMRGRHASLAAWSAALVWADALVRSIGIDP